MAMFNKINFGAIFNRANEAAPAVKAAVEEANTKAIQTLEQMLVDGIAFAQTAEVPEVAEQHTFIVPLIKDKDGGRKGTAWAGNVLRDKDEAVQFAKAYRCSSEALTAPGRRLEQQLAKDAWLQEVIVGEDVLRHHLRAESDVAGLLAKPLALLIEELPPNVYAYLVLDVWVTPENRKSKAHADIPASPFWTFNGEVGRPVKEEELNGVVPGLYLNTRIHRFEAVRLVTVEAERQQLSSVYDQLKGVTSTRKPQGVVAPTLTTAGAEEASAELPVSETVVSALEAMKARMRR